jgi:cytochrome c oxidase subunit 2
MIGIIHLHDTIIFYLLIIFVVVVWFLVSALFNRDFLFNLHHGNLIELIWTILPASMLWIIGVPSIKLLYLMDEILSPEITVKAIGNQWF